MRELEGRHQGDGDAWRSCCRFDYYRGGRCGWALLLLLLLLRSRDGAGGWFCCRQSFWRERRCRWGRGREGGRGGDVRRDLRGEGMVL